MIRGCKVEKMRKINSEWDADCSFFALKVQLVQGTRFHFKTIIWQLHYPLWRCFFRLPQECLQHHCQRQSQPTFPCRRSKTAGHRKGFIISILSAVSIQVSQKAFVEHWQFQGQLETTKKRAPDEWRGARLTLLVCLVLLTRKAALCLCTTFQDVLLHLVAPRC